MADERLKRQVRKLKRVLGGLSILGIAGLSYFIFINPAEKKCREIYSGRFPEVERDGEMLTVVNLKEVTAGLREGECVSLTPSNSNGPREGKSAPDPGNDGSRASVMPRRQ